MTNSSSMVAIWISVIGNITLTAIKIIVGLLFKSQVLIADGIHNAADIVASLASLISMRISNLPADRKHPYGHGKAEIIASAIVSFILILAALFMAYHSIAVLFEPAKAPHLIALLAALFSLILKQGLYIYTIKVAKQMNSKGLMATAYDHLADVYASLAAAVGIGIALIGQTFNIPFITYGDPIAGFIVSLFVLKLAFGMAKESINTLMEGATNEEKLAEYERIVQENPYVKRIDRLRAREHGHYIIIDVRVSVSSYLTIQEGHDVGKQIKKAIMAYDSNVSEVLVHLNPWYEDEKK